MSKRIVLLCCYIFGLFVTSSAAVDLLTNNENLELSLNGRGEFKFGQVVRGTGVENAGTVKDLWTEWASGGLSLETVFDKKLKLVIGIDADIKFSWPIEKQFSQTKTAQPLVSLGETYGQYSLGNDWGGFDVCAGYFGYKYNPEVKNLGEYLFRSATYPAYIITDFDYPQAKLLGLRIGGQLFDKSLSADIILSSETVFYPAMDWSLSSLISYDIANLGFITIGAGVSFAHLFSVYPDNSSGGSLTSPRAEATKYKDGDSTKYYTFKGTKQMARLSIDPLAFIREGNTYFGKDDFKIYGELLIIGTESYPDTTASGKPNPSYSNWKEKTPVTFGINLPTFKLLDVLNVEFEYWGTKYYNDYRQIYVIDGYPLAPSLNGNVTESKWKWSAYLKKSFFNEHCAIVVQLARDHMRLFDVLYDHANHREMLVEAGNWWWASKLSFAF
jgi:hypothetical protein